MSEPTNIPGVDPVPNPTLTPEQKQEAGFQSLRIHLWPNIPALYPMALVALICGIISLNWGVGTKLNEFLKYQAEMTKSKAIATAPETPAEAAPTPPVLDAMDMAKRVRTEQVVGVTFLTVFAFSMFVITVDIALTWALLWLAGMVIVGLTLFILNIYHQFLPDLFSWVAHLTPLANYQFYFVIFAIWCLLMILGLIIVRFHYIKFESNEVVVVGGVLDKRRRYSNMRMQYTKEVQDVFEYYLPFVRSGRLVLRFPNEEEPVILDNVLNIDKVIKRIEHLTSVMQVAPGQGD